MVAPKYAEQRSEFAKKIGLGRGTGRNSGRAGTKK
jgi:predicted transcriptional regulator